jgi:hypothetical protein
MFTTARDLASRGSLQTSDMINGITNRLGLGAKYSQASHIPLFSTQVRTVTTKASNGAMICKIVVGVFCLQDKSHGKYHDEWQDLGVESVCIGYQLLRGPSS